ncbi:MAG: DMT family transporter [Clostridia bacterium]|nr:DMT family transporter [Clostridia bacterium]
MNPSYLLVLLGVAMVSYSGPLVKAGLNAGANPASIALMRMVLSALILLPIMCVKRKGQVEAPIRSLMRMTRRQWLWSVAASVCLALHYLTWMTSLDATSTFASVALVCTQPLFVAALSGVVLKERMPKDARLGAIVAVVGALLIGANSLTGLSGDFAGDLLALAGAVLMAGHWLCNRYARRTVEALPFMLLLYAQTALILLCSLPFLGGFEMTWMALLCVLGLAVGCTLLGHSMFTLALGKVSATVVSFALLGEPVGAMLWSMLMFGEMPTTLLFIGGSVTIAGLVLYLMGSMGMLRRRG